MLTPGVSGSTNSALIPNAPSLPDVRAKITSRFAHGAFDISALLPLITYPSEPRVAVVDSEKASLPEPGSVIACRPIHSPRHSFPR